MKKIMTFVLVLLLAAMMVQTALAEDPRPTDTPLPPPDSCAALGNCATVTVAAPPIFMSLTPPPDSCEAAGLCVGMGYETVDHVDVQIPVPVVNMKAGRTAHAVR
jgi:hypothetical protein